MAVRGGKGKGGEGVNRKGHAVFVSVNEVAINDEVTPAAAAEQCSWRWKTMRKLGLIT